jgi:hypothetical protein
MFWNGISIYGIRNTGSIMLDEIFYLVERFALGGISRLLYGDKS